MESFIFAINAVLPIILTVALGYILKKIGFMDKTFVKMANKLVFRVFLPCMLFLNVYKIASLGDIDLGYVAYAVLMGVFIFVVGLPVVMLLTKEPGRRGVLWQSIYRSNYALIGIPLAQSLFGDEGAMVASLLSAFVVPSFNIFAVISLSTFRSDGGKPNLRGTLDEIRKNPLIAGILAGVLALGIRALFVRAGIGFRLSDIKPLFRVLEYMSGMATPMALLCLGGQFEFSAVRELRREILFGVLMRTVIVPVLGLGTAYLFFRDVFGGAQFAAFVAVFATPVAVSSVPMAQEMDGDVTLAGQLVVWTTLISAFSVFMVSFLLKAAGVF
ncbi:MAG: AEC family transporter [Clostridia bacterium]|nr:AEC family transporter [Clostridia bacterium]